MNRNTPNATYSRRITSLRNRVRKLEARADELKATNARLHGVLQMTGEEFNRLEREALAKIEEALLQTLEEIRLQLARNTQREKRR